MSKHSSQKSVFVSYSTLDGEYLMKVCRYLERHGFIPLYAEEQLELGKPWRPGLRDLIENADTMLVLFTSHSVQSPWVLYEFIWGLARGKQPIFLAQKGVTIPDPISEYQGVVLTGDHFDDEEMLSRLLTALRESAQQQHRHEEELDKLWARYQDSKPIDVADLMDVLRSIVNSYLDITSDDLDLEPNILHIHQKLRTLQEGVSNELLRDVFFQELDRVNDTSRFSEGEYYRQWSLGLLLSQTIKDPLYHLELTEPILVKGRYIYASKYLLTNGLYYLSIFALLGHAVRSGRNSSGVTPDENC